MKTVFADACYWIALLNPKDQLHVRAREASQALGPCRIVTSEMVLVEVLNGLSGFGEGIRQSAVKAIRGLEANPNVEIAPQTSLQFRSAAEHYGSRPDKEWSVTDCASFLAMSSKGLSEVLTHDHHFKQAGFVALL